MAQKLTELVRALERILPERQKLAQAERTIVRSLNRALGRRPTRWRQGWVSHRLRTESAESFTSWRVSLLCPALLMVAALLLAGCPKKPGVQMGMPGVQTGEPGAMGPGAALGPEGKVEEEKIAKPAPIREVPVRLGPAKRQEPGPGGAAAKDSPLKDVFFDFGEAALREDAKQTLNENIQWLRVNPQVRIMVEGHCDERGTNEYNLALGERRARAVRDFLVAGGIDAKRISTISYGEERPFVLGHDESAWKWNRRGHFLAHR